MGEVTKSRAMCNQGQLGMGRGRSRQDLGLVEVLFRAQTKQAETNSPDISLHGGPSKALTQEHEAPVHTRVTGEVGRMAPLKNIRANTIWNKQSITRTVTRVRLVLLSLADMGLDLQVTAATMQVDGTIASGSLPMLSVVKWQDRASGLVFFGQGK